MQLSVPTGKVSAPYSSNLWSYSPIKLQQQNNRYVQQA